MAYMPMIAEAHITLLAARAFRRYSFGGVWGICLAQRGGAN
ncbi:hypothetical protein ACLK1U_01900 [Escherichia coli]